MTDKKIDQVVKEIAIGLGLSEDTIKKGIKTGNGKIRSLNLMNNRLSKTSLPEGIFDQLTSLTALVLDFHHDKHTQMKKEEEEKARLERLEKARLETERREIEKQERYAALITNILKILQQITPNIQVQLSRISKLSLSQDEEVETILKRLLANDPDLGQYLEFEQVFIKKDGEITDDFIVKSANSLTQGRSTDALQICPHCKETQSTLIRQCTNCKTDLLFCNICKQGFSSTSQQLICPHCENIYHRTHLIAYIQSKHQNIKSLYCVSNRI